MADSFFGFNTTLNDSDDGGGLDPSEDEYDALNDETFGAAEEDGDWEQQHEEFLLTENDNGKRSDLEAYLSHLVLEDGEVTPNSSLPPPPVIKKPEERSLLHPIFGLNNNILPTPPAPTWLKNACTVEELERNLRQQQPQQHQRRPPPQQPNLGQIKLPQQLQQQQQQQQGQLPRVPMPFQPPNMMMPLYRGRLPPPGMMPPPGAMAHPFLGGPLLYRQPPPFMGAPMPPQHQVPQPRHPHFQNFNMPMGIMPRPQMDHMMGPNRIHPLQHVNNMMQPLQPGVLPLHHDNSDHNKQNNNKNPQNYQNRQKSWDNKLISELEYSDPDDPYSGLMTRREKRWLLNIQMMQLHTGTPYIDDYYYIVFMDRKIKREKQMIKEAHKANQQNHPFSQQNLNNRNHSNMNSNSNEGGRQRRDSTRSESNAENRRNYTPMQFENSLGKLQCSSVTAPRKIIDMEVVGPESAEPGPLPQGGNAGVVGGASRSTRQTLLVIESLYRILLRVEDIGEPLAIANALVLKERENKQKQLLQTEQMLREAVQFHNNDDDDHSSGSPPDDNFLDGNAPIKSTSVVAGSLGGTLPHPPASVSNVPNLLDENRHELLGKLFSGLLHEDRLAAIINLRKGRNLVLRILAQVQPQDRWTVLLNVFWPKLLAALPNAARREPHLLNPLIHHFTNYLSEAEEWGPVTTLCLLLCESASTVNHPRSMTPAPHYKNLMHFFMSTTLGLSMLVALCERAAVLPKPMPATWTNLICLASDTAEDVSSNARPIQPLQAVLLAMHTTAAGLSSSKHSALVNILC